MLTLKPLLSTRWRLASLYAGLVTALLAAQLNGCGQTHGIWLGDKRPPGNDDVARRPRPDGESSPSSPGTQQPADEHRRQAKQTPKGDSAAPGAEGDAQPAGEISHRGGSETRSEATQPAHGERARSRTVALSSYYYQRDEHLADLFSDREGRAGESMLCWPVALAYQARYQAEARTPRIASLSDFLGPRDDASRDVRSLMELCKTDRNDGTTMPKGARCIDSLFRKAGMKASIEVIGVDAMWSEFGMYPHDAATHDRAVALSDIIAALDRDASVIALIGFYQLSPDGKTWSRYSGHFLSITGYKQAIGASEEQIDLEVVNPAVRYDASPGTPKFDRVQVKRLAFDTTAYPAKVTYEMSGNGVSFTSYKTIMESLIVFSAAAP